MVARTPRPALAVAPPAAAEHVTLEFERPEPCLAVFGPDNRQLAALARAAGVTIDARGTRLDLRGPPGPLACAGRALVELYQRAEAGQALDDQDLVLAYRHLASTPDSAPAGVGDGLAALQDEAIALGVPGRAVVPKSAGQRRYVQALRRSDIVFAIGPAGTGKTYLAMAMAVGALLSRRFQRIVLTRPAVEAGERLGFLPGDLVAKVHPYLRPLYDALDDLLDLERAQRLLERNVIEVAPLAFMRGRTLNRAFVILDEAQNTTGEQMKMFLTRLGHDARAVVTGDVTQTDLPPGQTSGLLAARRLLEGIAGIEFCALDQRDVVRHPLVARIIEAYERDGAAKA